MAFRTEVMLYCSDDDAGHAAPISEFLLEHCRVTLRNVSKYSGGRKGPETSVYMTVCNYLPRQEFLEMLNKVEWRKRERVQLHLRPQNAERFEELCFVGNELKEKAHEQHTVPDS